jgi:hypothetical protein
MTRQKYSAATFDQSSPEATAIAQAHLGHIAMLREMRAHHRAIGRELQIYFEAVAAEPVPVQLLNSLTQSRDEETS